MDYRVTNSSSNELLARNFDVKHTIESGQPLTFLADCDWKKNRFSYVENGKKVTFKVSGSPSNMTLTLARGAPNSIEDAVQRFRLNEDLSSVYGKINTDKFMHSAISQYKGMRLTKNDPWETTVCFVLSQYSNIKRIKQNVRSVVDTFGTKTVDGSTRFPTSEELSAASEKQLRGLGLGFRAKYLKNAAEYCTNNIDLDRLGRKEYSLLKDSLMEIEGVGDKVADCIALMGYGRLEAFPIDVWVKRTMEKAYFKGKEQKIADIHEFASDQWGKHRGYAQQYIFHSSRSKKSSN
jgi:N-glycosylase/DNA lyase